jgi:hypothetical protein
VDGGAVGALEEPFQDGGGDGEQLAVLRPLGADAQLGELEAGAVLDADAAGQAVLAELGDQPVDGALGQADLGGELGEGGLATGMVDEDLQELEGLVDRGAARVG